MLTKEKAFGPDPRKSYNYRELPIGATSIGVHGDVMKTGNWRTAARPVFKAKTPPCSEACPAGVDVRGFISLMKQGLFLEAYGLYMDENPFPALCGRVCYHPCEGACNRKDFEQAVGINALERFLDKFMVVNLNEDISQLAVDLLKRYRLNHGLLIADALIAATTISEDDSLVSKNQRDYRFIKGLRLLPYPNPFEK